MKLSWQFALLFACMILSENPNHAKTIISCKGSNYASWQPHIYWQNGELKGTLFQYITERLTETNIALTIQPSKPRNRMLRDLLNGETDLILTAVYTEERNQLYTLSPPLFVAKLGLVGRKEIKNEQLSTLTATTMNFLENDAHIRSLINQGVEFTFVQSPRRAINMVANRVVDSIYINRDALINYPEFLELDNLTARDMFYHPESVLRKPLHIMFNKTSKCSEQIEQLSANIIEKPYPALESQ